MVPAVSTDRPLGGYVEVRLIDGQPTPSSPSGRPRLTNAR